MSGTVFSECGTTFENLVYAHQCMLTVMSELLQGTGSQCEGPDNEI